MTSRSGPARGVRPTSGRADLAMTQSPKRTGQLLAAYALSAAGGVFFFLGWAGFGIWPLELVALVPLWAAIELEIRRSWKTAFGLGLLFGTVVMAGGYHWILEPSRSVSEVSVLANLGLYAVCCDVSGTSVCHSRRALSSHSCPRLDCGERRSVLSARHRVAVSQVVSRLHGQRAAT